MGIFDFLKSDKKKPTIDLRDFKFLSNDHSRIENGHSVGNNKGAWRGINVKSSDNETFFVTMHNMNENHPVWGDNIQMAEKVMKLMKESNEKIILRGFGTDRMGASFADYGLTLHKYQDNINKVTLHMHDRNIDIVYEKAEIKKKSEKTNSSSNFENFKNFTERWNKGMSMQEKVKIAMESDAINNRGVVAYKAEDYPTAIKNFEQALSLMPNNDDALGNLKLCYSIIGDEVKVSEVEKKLNYLK